MSELTVATALAEARRLGVASLDAQLMLARLLDVPRTRLLAADEAALAPAAVPRWREWLDRRIRGEPLAYLFGEKEFFGLPFSVSPAVLVPRPETELLVEWALSVLERLPPGARVADLGTGSGAVALAVKHSCPGSIVSGSDSSRAALAVADANRRHLQLEIELVEGDWWRPFADRRFDLVVANPPYIASGDAHLDALRHEPVQALTPGHDGMAAIAAIVAGAPAHLVPGGWLLLEHGHDQAEAVRRLLGDAGWAGVESRADLAGLPRVTGGRWPATPETSRHSDHEATQFGNEARA